MFTAEGLIRSLHARCGRRGSPATSTSGSSGLPALATTPRAGRPTTPRRLAHHQRRPPPPPGAGQHLPVAGLRSHSARSTSRSTTPRAAARDAHGAGRACGSPATRRTPTASAGPRRPHPWPRRRLRVGRRLRRHRRRAWPGASRCRRRGGGLRHRRARGAHRHGPPPRGRRRLEGAGSVDPELCEQPRRGLGGRGGPRPCPSPACSPCPDDPFEALLMAVNHRGDSDTTGAIAGNLLGLLHGTAWLPAGWPERVAASTWSGPSPPTSGPSATRPPTDPNDPVRRPRPGLVRALPRLLSVELVPAWHSWVGWSGSITHPPSTTAPARRRP